MNKHRLKQATRAVLLLCGIGFNAFSRADSTDEMAKTLIGIRGEVEELQTQLDSLKQSHKLRMDSLNTELTDLNVENQRQTVTLDKLQQTLSKQQAAIQQQKNSEISLGPLLISSIQLLEKTVQSALPFKVDERLQALSELRQQIASNTLDGKKAANRLWAFIEDEIRLSRENGLYSQIITLEGSKRLAEVAKLGSVMMYFRTDDKRVGKAMQQDDGWHFVEFVKDQDKEKIAQLFDALQKQIRQGYFELPNPTEG